MAKDLNKEQRRNILTLIHRLESGKYNQVRGTLREVTSGGKEIGNCCLGVAANILVEKGLFHWSKIPRKETLNDGEVHFVTRLEGGSAEMSYGAALPTTDAINYFGFDTCGAERSQQNFWQMNDTRGASFLEIAKEMRRIFGFKPRKENAK